MVQRLYQIGALQALAKVAGTTVRYVKPHGALYNTIAHDERQATDVIEAIRKVKTGSSGFHQDVPKEDVIIERAEVV